MRRLADEKVKVFQGFDVAYEIQGNWDQREYCTQYQESDFDFASRLITRNEALSPAEHQLFSRALILSHSARARPAGDRRLPFFNAVIWIVDKEGDLPD